MGGSRTAAFTLVVLVATGCSTHGATTRSGVSASADVIGSFQVFRRDDVWLSARRDQLLAMVTSGQRAQTIVHRVHFQNEEASFQNAWFALPFLEAIDDKPIEPPLLTFA